MGASASSAPKLSPRSASAATAVVSRGHHLFKIGDYSLTKEMIPTGQCISSSSFKVGGHSWHVDYYPNGSCLEAADHVRFALVLEDHVAESVKVKFQFGLVDGTKTPREEVPYIRAAPVHSLDGKGNRETGLKKDVLQSSQYFMDDCFTIRCDIIVIHEFRSEKITDDALSTSVVAPPTDLRRHLGDLLLSKEGADVTFVVGDEMFVAHRYILAARSPVFKAELFGAMKESITASAIYIEDIGPRVFEALLRFIYTDSLALETKEREEGYMMAQHLLVAADRYNLARLKLMCEEKLCEHIDVNTAATTLVLAEQHHCSGLREACLKFIRSPSYVSQSTQVYFPLHTNSNYSKACVIYMLVLVTLCICYMWR